MISASETELNQSTAARYESLIRIAASVRAHVEPRDLFRILIQELGQVVPFDAIAQYDEGSNKVHWHMCPGCHKPRGSHSDIDKEETLAAWVYQHQETVAVGTLDRETRFPASTSLMREAGLQSVCAFPLSTAHRRLGSIVIASVHRDAYSAEELRFCSLVADQIALAMDDAFNFQASQRAQERLELLLDLTNRVVSNLNMRDVLREISANIRRVMQCDGVGIDLPSPEDNKLRLYALDFPDNPGVIEEGSEPPADEKASALQVFKSGEPVILSKEEIEREPALPDLGIQSLAHVPLVGRGGILGVLSLGSWRNMLFHRTI
jgi:formate hydrogenlyase transcriptional activator